MKIPVLASIVFVVFYTLVDLSVAANSSCKYRHQHGLPLHWPNPSSCNRFYRCSALGFKREVTCPSGRIYSNKVGRCVPRRRGFCKLSLIAPWTNTDNICANLNDGIFIGRPGYCRDYYICNDNVAYPQDCPSGSYFNTTELNCQPDNANSCWQNSCIGQQNGQFIPDNSSCINFYICNEEQAIQQSCSTGSYFNTTSNVCVPDPNGDLCWQNLCISQNDGTFLPNNENCHEYYVCVNKSAVLQYCPEGSYFNQNALACVPGDCPNDNTTTTESTTSELTTVTESSTNETTTTTECISDDSTTTTTECAPEESTVTTNTECALEESTTTGTECVPGEITTTTTECAIEEPTTTTTIECAPEEPTTTTTECAPVEHITTTTECASL